MIVPGRTSAYQNSATGWKISIPVFDTHGATSLFTTVEDLLKWQHNFVTGTVGSRRLLAEAETSALLNDGKPANYGFGISTEVYRGVKAFGHGGADAGYRADLVRFPEHQLDVAVACNFAEATPGSYARGVADILLEGKLGPVATTAAPPAGTVTIPGPRLAQLAGVYKQSKSDQALLFSARDGKLVLDNFGATLDPIDPSHFTAFGIIVQFDGPAGQPPTGVQLLSGGTVFESMVRMPSFTPRRESLADYAGDYWSDELRVGWKVAVEDSGLVLQPFKHRKQTLRPAFEDAFLSEVLGTIRFTRTKGKVTGLRVSGGRVRNVDFVRGSSHP
jgi:hypothetical protein